MLALGAALRAWTTSRKREASLIALVGFMMLAFGGGWPQGRILEKMGLDPAQLLRYNLSQPIVAQIVGITDIQQLKFAVNLARKFEPMPDAERDTLLQHVRDEAGDGRYETFKSTNEFDGPHHRKQHEFALA